MVKKRTLLEITAILRDNLELGKAVFATIPDVRIGDVLARFYGIGRECETLAAIGRSYGLTRERIRQIKVKGLRLICHGERRKIIEDFLATQREEVIKDESL